MPRFAYSAEAEDVGNREEGKDVFNKLLGQFTPEVGVHRACTGDVGGAAAVPVVAFVAAVDLLSSCKSSIGLMRAATIAVACGANRFTRKGAGNVVMDVELVELARGFKADICREAHAMVSLSRSMAMREGEHAEIEWRRGLHT